MTRSLESIKKYFGKYGEIVDSVLMQDRLTGKSRGFGFVTFKNPNLIKKVLADTHSIDGKRVTPFHHQLFEFCEFRWNVSKLCQQTRSLTIRTTYQTRRQRYLLEESRKLQQNLVSKSILNSLAR